MIIFRYSLAVLALALTSCDNQKPIAGVENESQPSGRLVPVESVLPPIGNSEQYNQLGPFVALPEVRSERDPALDQSQHDYEMSKMRKRLDALEDRQRQLEIDQRDYN